MVNDTAASAEDDCVDLGRLLRASGTVVRVLEELRECSDPSALARVASVSKGALFQVGGAVPPPLLDELGRLVGTGWSDMPTRDELRVFDAMLAGWVDGATRSARVKVELPTSAALGAPDDVEGGYL